MNKKNGLKRIVQSFVKLFSMFIQTSIYMLILFVLALIPILNITIHSYGGAFVSVSAVTVLLPFVILVDVATILLYEYLSNQTLKSICLCVGKVLGLLILTLIINRVDYYSSAIELTLYAESVYAISIYLIIKNIMKK